MSSILLSPLPKPGTIIWRLTWNSPVKKRRTYADYRHHDIAAICYSKILQLLPDSRPTLGYVKMPCPSSTSSTGRPC